MSGRSAKSMNSSILNHCPRCGAAGFEARSEKEFRCTGCDFQIFLNPAVSAAAIIIDEQKQILLIRRGRDPAKGKLALPGGFIDAGETAEGALAREIREELGLELSSLTYLCSFPNEYHYREVTYSVLDLYFVCTASSFDPILDLDEVQECLLVDRVRLDPDEIAFPSMRAAIRLFLASEGQALELPAG